MAGITTINQRTLTDILSLVASGSLVNAACARVGVPVATFYKELNADDELRAEYQQARESAAHTLAEQTLLIADGQMPAICDLVTESGEIIKGGWIDNTIESRKLRVSARQWIVERWNRRDYHTRTDSAINLSGNQTTYIDQLAAIHRAASERIAAQTISSQVIDADVSSQVIDDAMGEIVEQGGVVEGGTPKSLLPAAAVTPHDPKFSEIETPYPPANYQPDNTPPISEPLPEKISANKLLRKDYREGN